MFAVIMPLLVNGIVTKIIEETAVDIDEAFIKLYNSKLYEALERESTKVWTFSVPMLFDLYSSEMATGVLVLPEY